MTPFLVIAALIGLFIVVMELAGAPKAGAR
jgi:hypothetical protein